MSRTVCANAGIWAVGADAGLDSPDRAKVWRETLDTNLTGVWNTLEVGVPTMIDQGDDVTTQLMGSFPEFGTLTTNALPVDVVEPVDISNAILFLVGESGRYITGTALPVDAGYLV